MLFKRSISKSKNFLCLGLSLLITSSITLSVNKSEASQLNKHVDLIAQTGPDPSSPYPVVPNPSTPNPNPTPPTPPDPSSPAPPAPPGSVYWQNIDGGILGGDLGLTGNYAAKVISHGDTVYATNGSGNIFQYDSVSSRWTQIGGPGKEFVTDGTHLYGITPDGSAVAQYDGTPMQWHQIGGPTTHLYAGGGLLFATDPKTGDILERYPNDVWVKIGGPGKEFVVSDLGVLYGITPDGSAVGQFDGISLQWHQIGYGAAHLYAGRYSLYATDPNTGTIAQYQGTGTSWVQVGPPALRFTVSTDDHLYSLSPDGTTVHAYLDQPNQWQQLSQPFSFIYQGAFTNIYAGGEYIYGIDAPGDLLKAQKPNLP